MLDLVCEFGQAGWNGWTEDGLAVPEHFGRNRLPYAIAEPVRHEAYVARNRGCAIVGNSSEVFADRPERGPKPHHDRSCCTRQAWEVQPSQRTHYQPVWALESEAFPLVVAPDDFFVARLQNDMPNGRILVFARLSQKTVR